MLLSSRVSRFFILHLPDRSGLIHRHSAKQSVPLVQYALFDFYPFLTFMNSSSTYRVVSSGR